MYISATEMQTFLRCRRKSWLSSSYGMGCEPIKKSPALAVGTLVHAALETYYSSDDWEKTYHVGAAVLVEPEAGDERLRDDNLREKIELAHDVLTEYVYHYERMDESKYMHVVATEFAFEIPISTGYDDDFMRGRIDMLIYDDRTKNFWIVDHKTTSGSYREDTTDHNMQFTAYLWAVNKLWPDITFGGLMVNVLRLKDVKEPASLKGGGLSKNKSAITTRRLYELAIGDTSPRVRDDYDEHLDWLDANPKLFNRYWTFRQPETLKGFDKHIYSVVDEIRRKFTGGNSIDPLYVLPTFEASCNYMCGFQEVCHFMEDGDYPDAFIGDLIQVSEDRYTDDMEYLTPDNAAGWLSLKLSAVGITL